MHRQPKKPIWLKVLFTLLAVVAVLAALVAPVLLDEVPEAVPGAVESRFSEQLAFLRELALLEPPARCQDPESVEALLEPVSLVVPSSGGPARFTPARPPESRPPESRPPEFRPLESGPHGDRAAEVLAVEVRVRHTDPRDADWWQFAESRPELFDDPAIAQAKMTCHRGMSRFGFGIISRDRSLGWSRAMIIRPKEWPHVSVWHGHKNFVRYEGRIIDDSGITRSYELVVDMAALEEGPTASAPGA